MPEQEQTNYETKVRANIAYVWTFAAIILVGYTLWEYGHILAVLTLLIGYYTGVTSTINSVYFGAPLSTKKPDATTPISGDVGTVNNNVTTTDTKPE